MNRAICAPCGGLMNHVRWLLLLSPEFQWDTTNKVRYITNIVYPKRRSPFTWLTHEYMFREVSYFKKLIKVTHAIHDCVSTDVPNKVLVLTIDPKLSYKHYLKFNPGLNGLVNQASNDSCITLDDIRRSYELAIQFENDRNVLRYDAMNDILALNIDKLYTQRDLDVDFYNTVVDFFEISGRYDEANQIHNLWFDLQRDGENAMHSLPLNAEDVASYWRLPSNKAITQTEYDIALRLIKETYGE